MKSGRGMWRMGMAAAWLVLALDAAAQMPPGPPSGTGGGAGPYGMGQGAQTRQRGRGDGPGPQGLMPAAGSNAVTAGDGGPRGGQMSKEERRQLRRDVHEAGRDLYPERRRGGNRDQPPQ